MPYVICISACFDVVYSISKGLIFYCMINSRSFSSSRFYKGSESVSRLSFKESLVLTVRWVLLLGSHASYGEYAGWIFQARYAFSRSYHICPPGSIGK